MEASYKSIKSILTNNDKEKTLKFLPKYTLAILNQKTSLNEMVSLLESSQKDDLITEEQFNLLVVDVYKKLTEVQELLLKITSESALRATDEMLSQKSKYMWCINEKKYTLCTNEKPIE